MSFTLATARKVAQVGLRRASTAASPTNVQAVANNFASKLDPIIYYSKVVAEVAKQVYTKNNLQPPAMATMQEAQSIASSLAKSVMQGAHKTWTKTDVQKGAVLAGEAITFFLIGEVVGRRSLIGYSA
ncbi:ATP synthase subunit G atp20 [Allomyces arbusculus]|nr:ATP synthase subunit G atp20 [Allomyces arbusculus]